MIELKREMHWEENENENFKTPSHGDDLFCGCPFSYNGGLYGMNKRICRICFVLFGAMIIVAFLA